MSLAVALVGIINAFFRQWVPILLLGSMFFIGISRASVEGALSFNEAIKMALEQNKEILASRNQVEAAAYEVKASYGKFLPRIEAAAKYTFLNEPLDLDANSIRDAIIAASAGAAKISTTISTGNSASGQAAESTTRAQLQKALPAFNLEIQKQHYWNAGLSAVQPVFAGGKLIANAKAKTAVRDAADEVSRATRDRVIVEVASRYFGLQLMNDVVAIRKEVMDGLAEHESHAAKLLAEGMLPRAAKMRSDVALAEARREYSKAIRERELAIILLNNALNSDRSDYLLQSQLFMADTLPQLESLLNDGVERNPGLKALGYKQEALKQKYNSEVGDFLPTVALFGRYELYRRDLTALEPGWAVGIGAKIDLFNGGSDSFEMKAVRRERLALELQTDNAKELVKTEIRKYYHELNTAREQYASLQTSLDLAEENLRLNRLSFNEGVGTALDVIDAQLALGKVKTERKRALYEFDVALANLFRAAGDAFGFARLADGS